jgi:lysozyme family protein
LTWNELSEKRHARRWLQNCGLDIDPMRIKILFIKFLINYSSHLHSILQKRLSVMKQAAADGAVGEDGLESIQRSRLDNYTIIEVAIRIHINLISIFLKPYLDPDL